MMHMTCRGCGVAFVLPELAIHTRIGAWCDGNCLAETTDHLDEDAGVDVADVLFDWLLDTPQHAARAAVIEEIDVLLGYKALRQFQREQSLARHLRTASVLGLTH